MKRWFVRSVVLSMVVVLVLGLVPAASAASQPSIIFSNGQWIVACGAGVNGRGYLSFDYSYYVPGGYKFVQYWEQKSALEGSFSGSVEITIPSGAAWVASGTASDWISVDGYWRFGFKVYDPNGEIVSQSEYFGDCTTGEVRAVNNSIYGLHEPDAAHRVMATVNYDTPLFSTADPDAALSDKVWKAGQTWFVVGGVTGSDGQQWYEVYTGAANTAFVPAAALTLSGPLP